MARPFSITATNLFDRLFSDVAPVMIDIRVPDDISEDQAWLPGAHRAGFADIETHVGVAHQDRPVVLVCQGGLKLGQGAAARLAARGFQAGYVAGGFLGWRDAGLPLVRAKPGLWVSDGKSHADGWIAERILPKPNEILRVEPDQVALVADRFGGQVLPDAAGVLQMLDRPNADLSSALEFAGSRSFARLARGGDAYGMLDAWMRGAEASA